MPRGEAYVKYPNLIYVLRIFSFEEWTITYFLFSFVIVTGEVHARKTSWKRIEKKKRKNLP